MRGRREHQEHPHVEEDAEVQARRPDERQARRGAGLAGERDDDDANSTETTAVPRNFCVFDRPRDRCPPDLQEVVDEPHQPEPHRGEDQREPRGAERDPGGDREPRREVGDDEGARASRSRPSWACPPSRSACAGRPRGSADPTPRPGRARIATGVPSSVTARPTAPATRIEITAAPPPAVSRPATREPLKSTRSPGCARSARMSSSASSGVVVGRDVAPAPCLRGSAARAMVSRGSAHRDQPVDPDPRRQLPHALVLVLRDGAELGHLAEHRDQALFAGHPPRGPKRRRRGFGVRVVRVVQDPDARRRRERLHPPAGHAGLARAPSAASVQRDARARGPRRRRRARSTPCAHRAPRASPSTSASRPRRAGTTRGRRSPARPARAPYVGMCRPNPKVTTLPGHRSAYAIDDGVVRVQDRESVGTERIDRLGGGLDDRRPRPEDLHVRDAHVRHHDDVGPGDPRQELHVAEAPRPHLGDEDLGVGGAPSRVSGSPISLLNEPGLACTRKRVRATASREILRRRLAVRPRDRRRRSPSSTLARRRPGA